MTKYLALALLLSLLVCASSAEELTLHRDDGAGIEDSKLVLHRGEAPLVLHRDEASITKVDALVMENSINVTFNNVTNVTNMEMCQKASDKELEDQPSIQQEPMVQPGPGMAPMIPDPFHRDIFTSYGRHVGQVNLVSAQTPFGVRPVALISGDGPRLL